MQRFRPGLPAVVSLALLLSVTMVLALTSLDHYTFLPAITRAEPTPTPSVTPSPTATATSTPGTVEFRGLWVSRFDWTSSYNPGSPARIDEIVIRAAAANFNALLFQVRGVADAFYSGGLEPWSALLNSDGELGRDPQWDPLGHMVDRAHAAGLQVHAYVNVYPAWSGTSPPPTNTVPLHPFWTWSRWPDTSWADWRHWDDSGQPMKLNDGYLYASPGAPPVTDHVIEVVADIAARYEIDGMHLDYIRYAGPQYSCDPFSISRFPGDACFGAGWEDWQRAQVTELVRRAHQAMPSGVKLSAAVWPIYQDRWGWEAREGREFYYQDSQGWIQTGIIDILFPMIYPANYSADYWTQYRFGVLINDFQDHAAGRHIVAGIGGGYDDFSEIAARIAIARAAVPPGQTGGHAIFSYGLLESKGHWESFVSPGGPHTDAALPFRP